MGKTARAIDGVPAIEFAQQNSGRLKIIEYDATLTIHMPDGRFRLAVEDDMADNGNTPGKRRPRYRGTHPRRYEERYKELRARDYPGITEHIRAQGRTPAGTHIPVMLDTVMERLAPKPGEIVIDCTLGYGGHARYFARRIGSTGRLIALDADAAQLEITASQMEEEGISISVYPRNFEALDSVTRDAGVPGANIIFADLGLSSMQIDDPNRGFSYKCDGPLDMRMDQRQIQTAAELLRRTTSEELIRALTDLGDEPAAQAISEAIIARQTNNPLTRTWELADLIFRAKGLTRRAWQQQRDDTDLHPAARTFQAIRMLVNRETTALSRLLKALPRILLPGGRVGILTFHSGEDRLVKQYLRDALRGGVFDAAAIDPDRPSPAEVAANPRSRPAKFRWAILAANS